MLGDLYLGYAFYAPGTLVIKSVEGALVGYLNIQLRKRIKNVIACATIAAAVGGLEMVLGYFIYSQVVLGVPLAGALVELPFNLVQMAVGLIIAVPVMHTVLRVFPQLKSHLATS